jgi:protein O-GlcNAc transferase
VGAAEEAFQNAINAMNRGKPLEAEALFNKALALKPDLAEAWLGRGNVFAGLGRYDEAFAAYDKALALKPDLAGPWLGHLLANLGRHEESLAAYDKAIAVKPGLAEAWLGRCHSCVKLERYAEALAAYDRALAIEPGQAATWLGHLFASLERYDDALAAYDKTLARKADLTEAWFGRGNVLVKLKRLDDALVAYDRVLALRPDLAEAWLGRGSLLTELKRYDEAPAAYNKALALKPDLVEAWLSLGSLFTELGRHGEALAACDKARALKPDLAEAWLGRGYVLSKQGRFDEALAAYDKTRALKPDLAEALLGRANVLFKLQRSDEALAAYDKALALKPGLAEAWLGRGNVFTELERFDEALAACDKALALNPDLAETWLGRGNVFAELDHYDEALAAYDKALALKPDLAEAWLGRGNLFVKLERYDEAFSAYDRALALKPDLAEAWLGRGNLFVKLERYNEAPAAYDNALALKPDLAKAWLGRGNLFTGLKHYDEALAAYEKARALKPDLVGLDGLLVQSKLHLCKWDSFESDCNHLIESVGKNRLSTDPFTFLCVTSPGKDQYNCARLWTNRWYRPAKNPIWNGEIYKHEKIRIGYVSADFREHPVAHLLAGVLENHNKSMFDTTAVSIGPSDNSPMRRRLEGAFEKFLDAGRLSDAEVAAKIRSAEIDILVDLNGFTKNCRTSIFAHRPAPIQVNYLGYPGTMGADFIDYIVADRTIIPIARRSDFSEKIAYLPNSYQANDSTRSISEKKFTREECGLPNDGLVFCCFNHNYKITPAVFDLWMRILINVPGSVLWLRETNATAATNLKREAESRGVSAGRIIFAKRLAALPDHLARHRLADLFLDTLPYNAHTTASDALWAGLPVLTQIGETYVGRVAASLLNAASLPELVTHSSEQYERLAIEIAKHPEILGAMKTKLAENRLGTPLFDTGLFTRQIEAAYIAMYERYQAGLTPDTIVVPN